MNRYLMLIFVIILILTFFYLNPLGIQIGYKLSGGRSPPPEPAKNPAELLQIYKEQSDTYYLYKDSSNFTAQQWAEAAKQKANETADEYNTLINQNILGKIGDSQ